jgi:hypothetical protein
VVVTGAVVMVQLIFSKLLDQGLQIVLPELLLFSKSLL